MNIKTDLNYFEQVLAIQNLTEGLGFTVVYEFGSLDVLNDEGVRICIAYNLDQLEGFLIGYSEAKGV